MKEVTAIGQTVKQAVESALAQLQITSEQADIVILDEGKRGLFGIFGNRTAKVIVTVKVNPIDEAAQFLTKVCTQMGAPSQIEIVKEGKTVQFLLSGDKTALLIGKRGQTLNSLQFLTQLVLNQHSDHYYNLIVDAENYRKRRIETLIQLAEKLALRAIRTNQEITLEPMSSQERKTIHAALVRNKKVKTYSVGKNEQRHIIISPVK